MVSTPTAAAMARAPIVNAGCFNSTTALDSVLRYGRKVMPFVVNLKGHRSCLHPKPSRAAGAACCSPVAWPPSSHRPAVWRSEEHTSELQSLMRISYAVFCLKKKKKKQH